MARHRSRKRAICVPAIPRPLLLLLYSRPARRSWFHQSPKNPVAPSRPSRPIPLSLAAHLIVPSMSTLLARSDARRVRGGSVWKGAREPPDFLGSGGTTTASPAASTAAAGVVSGSPARRWRASCSGVLPFSNFSASAEVSQRPSLVMPIGTTSYLLLSIAPRTDAAERRETSCSPLRPPKRMPTRSFFMTLVWTRVSLASISRYDLSDLQKKKEYVYERPIYHDEPPRS